MLSLVAVAAMLTSCVQQEISQPDFENIEAVAELPVETDAFGGTKSVVKETDTGIEMIWGTSESIGVYGSRLTNVKFVGTNKYYEQASTTFKGGSLFSSPKYAYYPYSEDNASNSADEVRGNIPQVQYFSTVHRKMNTDYKIGVYASSTWNGYKFNFYHLMTFLRFKVNADGTPLLGDKLQKVTFEVMTAQGQPRQLVGGFTMDITKSSTQAVTSIDEPTSDSNKLTLVFSDTPTLSSGKTILGYASAFPSMIAGDIMSFEIVTDKHIARITRPSKVAFSINGLVNFPLTLANFSDMVVEDIPVDVPSQPETPAVGTHPVLKSMKFTVADNPGKILPGQVSYNTSSKRTTYSANKRSEEACTVDTVNHKVTAFIPYLGSRKLVPTFEIPEGTMLYYEGGEIINGVTEVDFARFKQIAVVNEVGQGVIYDVELTNTGLPVVVVNQVSGLSRTSDGFWENATGTQTQAKDSDWIMEDGDSFMVYNPDGTSALLDKNGANVDVPVLSSTRLRGNVSQKMPKKPFAVKLDKKHAVKITKANGEVVNMPAHKRWVLLANWSDRTLMRNAVAYDVAKIFENNLSGSIAWNVSGEFVELVYNGVHVGNYYLCEQVKIDGNRLDIADPYDKDDAYSGNPADYGYLLECDDAYDESAKFMSKHYIPFQFKDDADAGGEMLQYAKDIVYGIEENLYKGYSGTTSAFAEAYKTMDLTSFVDFLLIQELMMNGELKHPKSCYTYINDGKLYAGPIWDFDWQTIPNISVIESYYDNAYTGGANTYNYTYTTSMLAEAVEKSSWFSKTYYCFRKSSGYPSEPNEDDRSYMWYPMLVKDATFKATAAERWNAISGLVTAYANTEIPKMAAEIRKSEELNWSMWKLESGSGAAQQRWSTYDVGGGFKGDEAMTFDNAVSTLSSNLNNRINGMSYVSNQSWPSITIQSSSK